MKIAVVTTYATPSNMREELLATMRTRAHDVCLVAPAVDKMDAALHRLGARFVPWPITRTSLSPFADLRAAQRLASIFRTERPDVVLVYQIKAVLVAPFVARWARVPRIVALVNGLGAAFDDTSFGASWTAGLARRIYGTSVRRLDHVIFQNADDPEVLRHYGFLDVPWSVVAGSGVDIQRIRALPVFSSPPTFTLTSRLLVSKGVRDFIDAARIVRCSHPDARFVLAGGLEADHPDSIARREIDAWVAEGIVDYVGFVSDVVELLARTSVFVLPSYYREGIPRTNLEALAAARPVISTDSVGCRETVRDGENGYLVQPRDPAGIAEAMRRYLEEPDLLERHGRASRHLAEERFDVRLVNEAMFEALGIS